MDAEPGALNQGARGRRIERQLRIERAGRLPCVGRRDQESSARGLVAADAGDADGGAPPWLAALHRMAVHLDRANSAA
jgi:hypothetical protein